MDIFAIIKLLGGLAMFLYGIEIMGDGLKNSSGAALKKVLEKYQLPTQIAQTRQQLLPYLLHDKKMGTGRISVVFVEEIGTFTLRELSPEEILDLLE